MRRRRWPCSNLNPRSTKTNLLMWNSRRSLRPAYAAPFIMTSSWVGSRRSVVLPASDRGKEFMPTDVVMPQMGESIFEGTITKWLKKPGDTVKRDEPLFEISTDKVDAEIPSPTSGVLQEIKVTEGNTVQVNTVVGSIGDGDG